MSVRGTIGLTRGGINKLNLSLCAATAVALGYQATQLIRAKDDQQLQNLFDEIVLVEGNEQIPRKDRAALRDIARKVVDADRLSAAQRKLPWTWRLSLLMKRMTYSAIVKAKELSWYQFFSMLDYDFRLYSAGLKVMIDAGDYPDDKVWCENVAVIDLDASQLEVYTAHKGFEAMSQGGNRWPATQHLVLVIGFDEIRSIADMNQWWSDFERHTGLD